MQALGRFVSRCCFWLLALVVLVAGGSLLLATAFPQVQARLLPMLPALFSRDHSLIAYCAAMGLLLLVLLAAWTEFLLLKKPPSTLTFNTVEGTVSIAPATLARFVREVIYACRGVVHARVVTDLDGRKMAVTAWIRFSDEQPVTQFASDVQHAVRRRVRDVFGFDLLRDIRIEVAGIEQRGTGSRRLLGWAEAPEADSSSTLSTGT